MKKIYMSPTMDVIELKSQQALLTGSTLGIGDPGSAINAESPEFPFEEEQIIFDF